MMEAIRSEYRKLVTTRTAAGLFAGLLVLTGLAVFGSLESATRTELAGGLSSPFGYAGVLVITSVFVLVLALRSFTDEVRHGSVVPTFLATPDRRRVLAAKAVVSAAAAAIFAVGSLAVSTAVIAGFLATRGIAFSFSAGALAPLFGRAIAIAMLWAVIGVAVGAVVRHQVAAIVGTLAWLFVGENIVGSLAPAVAHWLPSWAAGAAAGIDTPGMSVAGGLAVLTGWAVLGAAGAVVAITRRDVA